MPLTNWCGTAHMAACLRHCSPQGDGRWGRVEIVNAPPWDFLAVFNAAEIPDDDLAKAIVFQCETPLRRRNAWSDFYRRCETKAFYFFDIPHHHCVDKWFVDMPWRTLIDPVPKTRLLSGCISAQEYLPLHAKRVRAVRALASLPSYRHYGYGDWKLPHGCYLGAPTPKNEALDSYLFHFNCENDREKNYFTEKATDAFLRECVLLYDGCPNLEDFFPADSFIRVNVDDQDSVLAAASRLHAPTNQQRAAVSEAKRRVMYDYNPLAILDRILA